MIPIVNILINWQLFIICDLPDKSEDFFMFHLFTMQGDLKKILNKRFLCVNEFYN